MNSIEGIGFLISIAVSIYLYREVNKLKGLVDKAKESTVKNENVLATSEETVSQQKGDLTRLQGFRVGHVQEIDVGNGRILTVITKALKPLIFEIPNFLNDQEIESMIGAAKKQILKPSEAKSGLQGLVKFKRSNGKGKAKDPLGQFSFWDTNKDGFIDIQEAMQAAKRYNQFVRPGADDIRQMYEHLESKAFDDELISEEEWNDLDTIQFEDQFNYWNLEDPRFMARFSEQTWLQWNEDETGVLNDLRERVTKLTKLPRRIISGGEPVQVGYRWGNGAKTRTNIAHYLPGGHYHAHYDSETHLENKHPCCHQHRDGRADGSGRCVLCRFITIMTYMNDVEQGGETAFINADNSTHDSNFREELINLSHHCKDASLVVTPKKGTAIFWYNHHVDANNGWLGEMDNYGLHGGCDVIRGEKWISNIWLTAPYEKDKDQRSVYDTSSD